MKYLKGFVLENKAVVVVGGGHAGVEAALAVSRLGVRCFLVTMKADAVGRLSCNPAIGGLAKTHLVKEIDALGGVMGYASDLCALQYKTLNKTKGRAVWSTRAQLDKKKYPVLIQKIIKKNKNIKVLEGEITNIKTKKGHVCSVLVNKKEISCFSVVVACGTFSQGLIHIGSRSYPAGRFGEKNSKSLSMQLKELGHSLIRLKTGTPPRISLDSIKINLTDIAKGDDNFFPFSLYSGKTKKNIVNCYSVNTNPLVHGIIKKNLHLSPMFSGKIEGVGPRYCPSIEDKIFRFKNRSSHLLFLEPEWLGSNQIYVNGFSTSLPYSVQIEALRAIPALESVEFIRPGYAIEYDVVPPRELKSSLESKLVGGLFLAGQINGTSGYEEAGAQGLVAGVNAALSVKNYKPLVLQRTNSYIGVLIDDLVTSHLDEPYRMFTSRAEHRLFLRPDNCYSRLYETALSFNLYTKKQKKTIKNYFDSLAKIKNHIKNQTTTINKKKIKMKSYLKRPHSSFWKYNKKSDFLGLFFLKRAVFQAETEINYSGYIENELERINKNSSLEGCKIPAGFDYGCVNGLSNESRERLSSVKPETLGQASRIFGVRPTDITLLGFAIKK